MNPKTFLDEAASLIDDRGNDYGGIEQNFETIASLANTVLNRDLSAFDVAMILHCVKLARLRTSPTKRDNYLDGVNYLAFAGEMAAPAPVAPSNLKRWRGRPKESVEVSSAPLSAAQMDVLFAGGDTPETAQPQERGELLSLRDLIDEEYKHR